MTKEEFEVWVGETMPSALFHVGDQDKDDKYGVKLDELILIELIAKNPEVLKFKSLDWLVNHFINTYTLQKNQAEFNIKNRFSIDFFEFSFLVETCIPPVPIARHCFWEDVINKYYNVLTPDERTRLYEWINLMPNFNLKNEDCQLFNARFDPRNQFEVLTKFEGETKLVEAFLWKEEYYTGITRRINKDYIIEVKPKPIIKDGKSI